MSLKENLQRNLWTSFHKMMDFGGFLRKFFGGMLEPTNMEFEVDFFMEHMNQ